MYSAALGGFRGNVTYSFTYSDVTNVILITAAKDHHRPNYTP